MSSLDIQVEKFEYCSPVCLKFSCRWRNITSHIPFFSSNGYEPMALWLRLITESLATWAGFLMSAETLAVPLPFYVALSPTQPVSALTR